MSRIDHTIEVDVPVRTAYNQWTQFEEFPRFMEGVDRVVQLDDRMLEWTATIAGQTRQWQARIVDQVPDERIAWVSTSGARNDGIVAFRPLAADRTRIDLAIEYEPEGTVENLGDALGVVEGRVRGDLERFRDFVEQQGVETGAWRGAIPDDLVGDVSAGHPSARPVDRAAVSGAGSAGSTAMRSTVDEEATGRGFAEGSASPALTRQPAGGSTGRGTDLDEEATGRGFAEGIASPELTRKEPGAVVDEPALRRTTR